jgi:hypothetical protein
MLLTNCEKSNLTERKLYPHLKRVIRVERCAYQQADGSYAPPVELARIKEMRFIYVAEDEPDKPYVRIKRTKFYLTSVEVPVYEVVYKQLHLAAPRVALSARRGKMALERKAA